MDVCFAAHVAPTPAFVHDNTVLYPRSFVDAGYGLLTDMPIVRNTGRYGSVHLIYAAIAMPGTQIQPNKRRTRYPATTATTTMPTFAVRDPNSRSTPATSRSATRSSATWHTK